MQPPRSGPFPYAPINRRPTITWPNGARLALWVIPNVETAHARHLLGDIATHSDRFDAESGEAHYRQALALAEPRGMRPLGAHCHPGLGKLYRRTDKREQAQEPLTTASTMYRETGMTYWLEKAEADMKQLR